MDIENLAAEHKRMTEALGEIMLRNSAASVEGDIARRGLGLPQYPSASAVCGSSA